MNVVLYDRFATDNHAGKEAFAADRLLNMRTWCHQNGYHILTEYIEQGNQHVGDDRPAFQQLQEDVFSGNHSIEAIVVLSASRLFRNLIELAVFERKLQAHGVHVIFMAGGQNDHQNGQLMRGLINIFDGYQSDVTSKRATKQKKALSS